MIQVLTQAREPLIIKTIESLRGSKNAIIHLYNSTSTLQRRVVFRETMAGVKKIATDGAKIINEQLGLLKNTNLTLQYSPESFTGTELDYALEVCEAVLDAWNASPEKPVIINLPATVEMSTPNIYADQMNGCMKIFLNAIRLFLCIRTMINYWGWSRRIGFNGWC